MAKATREKTAGFRVTAADHEQMKSEAKDFGFATLSHMIRVFYDEGRSRRIAERKVHDARRGKHR